MRSIEKRKKRSAGRDLKVCCTPKGIHQPRSYSEQNAGPMHSHHTCTEALRVYSDRCQNSRCLFQKEGKSFFFFFFLFEALIIAWVFTRTRLYMLWLQEIHNHHWFVLVILNLTAEVHIKVQHRGKTRALH